MLDLYSVERRIGHSFKNKELLKQAFVRASYSHDNPGVENNEILEFIGDKVLDLAVIDLLMDSFSEVDKQLHCSYSEGELTEMKKMIVNKNYLSSCIDRLEIAELMKLGGSDNSKKITISMKEDLFEAIVGALYLDCSNNRNFLAVGNVGNYMDKVKSCVAFMLDWDSVLDKIVKNLGKDYYMLVQKWTQLTYKENPKCEFEKCCINAAGQSIYKCYLHLGDIYYEGEGDSKIIARYNATVEAYNDLLKEGKLDFEEEIDESVSAINLVQEMSHKLKVPFPTYKFEERKGVWYCVASYSVNDDEIIFHAPGNSKKEAKKAVAEMIVRHLKDEEII